MVTERKDMSPLERVDFCKDTMRKIIDGAKGSINDEFLRSPNNWTACFKSIIF